MTNSTNQSDKTPSMDDVLDLLCRLEDYMDDKADADWEDGFKNVPNKEMIFLTDIRSAIETLPSLQNKQLLEKIGELEGDVLAQLTNKGIMEIGIKSYQQRISELEEGLRKIAEHPEEPESKFPMLTIAAFKQIAINLLINEK